VKNRLIIFTNLTGYKRCRSGANDIIGIVVLLLSAFSLFIGLAASQSTIPGPTIAVSVNPSTNNIYVANPASGIVSVIAGSTDTVAKTIRIPRPVPVSITP
jgi:hypothetical protein